MRSRRTCALTKLPDALGFPGSQLKCYFHPSLASQLSPPDGQTFTSLVLTRTLPYPTHLSNLRTPGEGDVGFISLTLIPGSWISEMHRGRSVSWDDCRRVFTTSRGQVRMAPAVPPHLGHNKGITAHLRMTPVQEQGNNSDPARPQPLPSRRGG